MNHFKKIAGVLEAHGLDAVLLTCEANRFYASGFHSSGTDGVAIVTRNRSYYFTDSRYTEAAARYVQGAEIRQTDREHPYSALINEVTEKEHITRMGYEDEYMTAADFRRFSEKLHCELVPATELLWTAPTAACPTVFPVRSPFRPGSSSPWTSAANSAAIARI